MRHFCLHPPSKTIILAENNEKIVIIDIEKKSLSTWNILDGVDMKILSLKTIDLIAISPNYQYLLVVVNGKIVIVYKYSEKLNTWESTNINTEVRKKINCLVACSDLNKKDQYCYYGQTDGDIFRWNYIGKDKIEMSSHFSYLTTLTITPCGKYLISGDRDCCIRIVSLHYPYEIVSFCMGHSGTVTSFAVIQKNGTETSYMLVSSSAYGELFIWDPIHGNVLDRLKLINDKNGSTIYTDTIKCEDNTTNSNCISNMVYSHKYSTIVCIVEKFLTNGNDSVNEIVSIAVDKEKGLFLRETIKDLNGEHKYSYGQIMLDPNNDDTLFTISSENDKKTFYINSYQIDYCSLTSTIALSSNIILHTWNFSVIDQESSKIKNFKSFCGFRLGLNIPPRKRLHF